MNKRHGPTGKLIVSALMLALPSLFIMPSGAVALSQQSPSQSQSDVSTLIQTLASKLRSSDEEERLGAVIALIALKEPQTAPLLVSALKDDSELVRANAVTGLGGLADPAYAAAAIDRLANDKDPFVRKSAAYALGQLKTGEGTLALVAALGNKNKKYEEVRAAAVIALGQYRDPQAIPALINALSDKSEFIRARAAEALGGYSREARQAVPALIKLLTADPENAVKRLAATALGQIGDPAALPALDRAQLDSDPYLSRAALGAIEMIKQATASR